MPLSLSPALESVVELFRCPNCGDPLGYDRGALRCPTGHTFDISRYGYVSLLASIRATSGDEAEMVRARDRFLTSGRYDPIRQAAVELAAVELAVAANRVQSTVVDVGCGTGYYLAGALDRMPGARGLGLDTSVHALRITTRAHQRAAAATWDVFRPLPLADGVADIVLDVFAPRNPAEFHRVLRPGGLLVVVRPTGRHLVELRSRMQGMITVDPEKEPRLQSVLAPYFTSAKTELVEYTMALSGSEVRDLVGMTPSARHLTATELDEIDRKPEQVTASVLATVYRRL